MQNTCPICNGKGTRETILTAVCTQYIHYRLQARPSSEMPGDETDMHDEDLLDFAEAMALAIHSPTHPCPKCRFPEYQAARHAAIQAAAETQPKE
jgi:hypothetical protein